jgi:coenzyme F420-0:L-glutamate ligase/coenzyme F420-1:gamma-L-glutamate ligase
MRTSASTWVLSSMTASVARKLDLFGRAMQVTVVAVADEIAAAASLLTGQADEGLPVVLARGLSWNAPERPVAALMRPKEYDLLR